jgi:hypothetical protein
MKIDQISDILAQIAGVTFAGIDSTVEVKLKGGKSNLQNGHITKKTIGSNVMLFTNTNSSGYENMVKKHLEKEGLNPDSFTVGERKWGFRIPNSPIIVHNGGTFYLDVIFLKAGKSEYFLDGKHIDKENIVGLDEKISAPSQGLSDENIVVIRTYKLSSIDEIRLFGEQIKSKSKESVKVDLAALRNALTEAETKQYAK